MRRILCTSIALIMLLTAYSAPVQQVLPSTEQGENYIYGVFEFTFDVERLSGWLFEDWEFVHTYNGEEIQSGHRRQIQFLTKQPEPCYPLLIRFLRLGLEVPVLFACSHAVITEHRPG